MKTWENHLTSPGQPGDSEKTTKRRRFKLSPKGQEAFERLTKSMEKDSPAAGKSARTTQQEKLTQAHAVDTSNDKKTRTAAMSMLPPGRNWGPNGQAWQPDKVPRAMRTSADLKEEEKIRQREETQKKFRHLHQNYNLTARPPCTWCSTGTCC